MLTHGSLFSGIGGFDLAAEWAGFDNRWQVEKDPFCQRVLRKHFPEATLFDNITTLDLHALEHVDLVSGGCPCQPFSNAGQRRGKEDDRYLWREMLKVVQVVRPAWVVCENVAGYITMELDHACSDLEAEGYTCWPLVLPACAVGAPHRRDRVWIIAFAQDTNRRKQRRSSTARNQSELGHIGAADSIRPTADTFGARLQGHEFTGASTQGSGASRPATEFHSDAAHAYGGREQQPRGPQSKVGRWDRHGDPWAEPWPTVIARLCRVDDGLPRGMDRRSRIKALGNTIVPQVAYQIFDAIKRTYE